MFSHFTTCIKELGDYIFLLLKIVKKNIFYISKFTWSKIYIYIIYMQKPRSGKTILYPFNFHLLLAELVQNWFHFQKVSSSWKLCASLHYSFFQLSHHVVAVAPQLAVLVIWDWFLPRRVGKSRWWGFLTVVPSGKTASHCL